MVQLTNIQQITTNTTLSTSDDVYLINASGGNITITLPTITADGMNYKLIRTDVSTNTVTVQRNGVGGNLIFQNNVGSISITIFRQVTTEVQSYNNNWYAVNPNLTVSTITATDLVSTTVTSPAAFVLIPSMTITPARGTYLVMFSSSGYFDSANTRGEYTLFSDGSIIQHSERIVGDIVTFFNAPESFTMYTQAVVTVDGTQAIQARWRRETGSGTFYISPGTLTTPNASYRSLTLLKIS